MASWVLGLGRPHHRLAHSSSSFSLLMVLVDDLFLSRCAGSLPQRLLPRAGSPVSSAEYCVSVCNLRWGGLKAPLLVCGGAGRASWEWPPLLPSLFWGQHFWTSCHLCRDLPSFWEKCLTNRLTKRVSSARPTEYVLLMDLFTLLLIYL